MAALGFETPARTPALENGDDGGNAGDGADRFENRALDVGSVSAKGNVK
jgi:hypothetical protein